MLGVFNKNCVRAPPELARHDAYHRPRRSGDILAAFRAADPQAITVQFDDVSVMAVTYKNQSLLRPRSLGVVDGIFCMFEGNLENLPQLRRQYGLSKGVNEAVQVIEMYRCLRDRAPYPPDQVVKSLGGYFAYQIFDSTTRTVFVAADCHGKVPMYWGTTADGALAFSDNMCMLKEGCGKTCSPFPSGCFFSSVGGLHSFEDPLHSVKCVAAGVDTQGQACGALFQVDVATMEVSPRFPRVGSGASWATAF